MSQFKFETDSLNKSHFFIELLNLPLYDAKLTMMHLACMAGELEAVKYLITAGANKEAFDSQLRTPLFYAVESQSIELVRELCAWRAILYGQDIQGFTPLHLAAFSGNIELASLICSTANIDKRCNIGFTALYLAEQEGNTEMARYLRQKGAYEKGSCIRFVSVLWK